MSKGKPKINFFTAVNQNQSLHQTFSFRKLKTQINRKKFCSSDKKKQKKFADRISNDKKTTNFLLIFSNLKDIYTNQILNCDSGKIELKINEKIKMKIN